MNTIYRIVWNAVTGKWNVASELAKGRKKKAASAAGFVVAVGLAFVASSNVAMAQTASGNGGLYFCPGSGEATSSGSTIGYGGNGTVACNSGSASFSLINDAAANGAPNGNNSASVRGYRCRDSVFSFQIRSPRNLVGKEKPADLNDG